MKTLVFLALLLPSMVVAQSAPYKLAHRAVLGGEGGWDYVTFDSAGDRLFIAHGTQVLVATTDGKKLGSMPAEGVHGIALVPGTQRGFFTNGRAGTVTVFDTQTVKVSQQIKAGENPDAIIYDPHSKHILVMNGRSHDLMAIDPATLKVDATVPLGGKLEFAATDAGHVFVNVEDTSEIAVVDSKSWKATARWKLAGCEEPTGLAIDETRGRLFTGCGNAKMLVLDSTSGKEIASLPSGSGTDAAVFDAARQLILTSNGEGTLSVIRQKRDGGYETVGNVKTVRGARTMALDPKSGRVFLITDERNGQGLELLVYEPAIGGQHSAVR